MKTQTPPNDRVVLPLRRFERASAASSAAQLEAAPKSERSEAYSLPSGNMDSDPDRLKRLGQGATGGQNGSDS